MPGDASIKNGIPGRCTMANELDPAEKVETLRAEVARLRAELAEAQAESERDEAAMLRAELAEVRRSSEYQSGTIVALRAMLAETRAASHRPAGLDGRRLVHRPGTA
jgi:hypothetical protein